LELWQYGWEFYPSSDFDTGFDDNSSQPNVAFRAGTAKAGAGVKPS